MWISVALLGQILIDEWGTDNYILGFTGLLGLALTVLRVRQLKYFKKIIFILLCSLILSITSIFFGFLTLIPIYIFGAIYLLIVIYGSFFNSIKVKSTINLFKYINGFQLLIIHFFLQFLFLWSVRVIEIISDGQEIAICLFIFGIIFIYTSWIRSKGFTEGFNPFYTYLIFFSITLFLIYLLDNGTDLFEKSKTYGNRRRLLPRTNSGNNYHELLITFTFLSTIYYQLLLYFINKVKLNFNKKNITKFEAEKKIKEFKKFLDKGLIDKKDFNKKTENFKKVLLDDNAIEGNPSFFNSSYVKVVGVSSVFILVLSYLVGPFDKIFW